jgi:hypothetical protein
MQSTIVLALSTGSPGVIAIHRMTDGTAALADKSIASCALDGGESDKLIRGCLMEAFGDMLYVFTL